MSGYFCFSSLDFGVFSCSPRSFVGLNLFLFRRFLCLLHFVYDASNIIMNVAEQLAGFAGKNGVVVGSSLKLEGSGSLCWWLEHGLAIKTFYSFSLDVPKSTCLLQKNNFTQQ